MSQIDRPRAWLHTHDQLQGVDVLLALMFVGFGIATVWDQELIDGMREPNGFTVVLVVLVSVPIAFRRRAPLLTVAISCAAICWLVLAGFPEGVLPFAVMLLSYTVGASNSLRRAIAGLVIIGAAVAALRIGDAPGFDGFVAGANSRSCRSPGVRGSPYAPAA